MKLPEGTFGGQWLTGTYSKEDYGERRCGHLRRKRVSSPAEPGALMDMGRIDDVFSGSA